MMKNVLMTTAAMLALIVGANAHVDKVEMKASAHHHHSNEFPPRDAEGKITYHPHAYFENDGHPYWSWGGHYWYPHDRADRLADYEPYFFDGYYWYASKDHPTVYMSGNDVMYVLPHPMDKPMDDAMGSPMQMGSQGEPAVK